MGDVERLRRNDLRPAIDSNLIQAEENVWLWRQEWEKGPLDPEQGDDLDDPEMLTAWSFNETMMQMKEHLLGALTNRRKQVLPVALEIFNKIQNKQFKLRTIDDYQRAVDEADPIENVQGNLDKIHYILDDPRSPLVGVLVESEKYDNSWVLPDEFKDAYPDEEDTKMPIDIDTYIRDQERMSNASTELDELHKTLMAAKFKIFEEKCHLESGKEEVRQKDAVFLKNYNNHVKDLYKQF